MCLIACSIVASVRTATKSGDMRRPAECSGYSRSSWTSSDFSSCMRPRIFSACSVGSSSTTSAACSARHLVEDARDLDLVEHPHQLQERVVVELGDELARALPRQRTEGRDLIGEGSWRSTAARSAGCARLERRLARGRRPSPGRRSASLPAAGPGLDRSWPQGTPALLAAPLRHHIAPPPSCADFGHAARPVVVRSTRPERRAPGSGASTLTRGSPSRPSWRPSVCFATRSLHDGLVEPACPGHATHLIEGSRRADVGIEPAARGA